MDAAATGTGAAPAESIAAEVAAAVRDADSPSAALLAAVERLGGQPGWDWVGVYVLCGDTLRLGPFVGEPTEHARIPVGTGVCGAAVAARTDQVVADVGARDEYLACSASTRSELVVLIEDGEEILGQVDVDSDAVGTFGDADVTLLRGLAPLLGPACRALRDGIGT